MVSPIDTLGLGSISPYTTMYDSYMPSAMYSGMYPSYNYSMIYPGMCGAYGDMSSYNYGMTYPGMYGMMGYPLYAQQMQNQIETMNMEHNINMHDRMVNNEATAYEQSATAMIRKNLPNSSIQQGIQNLYQKIQLGDQEGVCQEFDRLKLYVKEEYKELLASKSNSVNTNVMVNNLIEQFYSSYLGGRNLREDIEKFGESSFVNGWKQGLKPGHQEKYTDKTLNHIYGTSIDEYSDKQHKQSFGKAVGSTAYTGKKLLTGFGIGFSAWGIWKLLSKGLITLVTGKKFSEAGKKMVSGALENRTFFKGKAGVWVGLAVATAYAIGSWKNRNKDKS